MKTSKKILLIVAGIFGGLLIVSLISFRKETMAVVSDIQARSPFAPVAVEGFDQVDFSGKWNAKIRFGLEQRVLLQTGHAEGLNLVLENVDGTLYLKTANNGESLDTIHVKITVPRLRTIRASGGTMINYADFDSDTLRVVLEGGSTFSGYENVFDYTSFEVSGDSQIKLSK